MADKRKIKLLRMIRQAIDDLIAMEFAKPVTGKKLQEAFKAATEAKKKSWN